MEDDLKEIENIIENFKNSDLSKISELLNSFFKKHITRSHIDKYIGDYPTFIEPVYLENNVKIGDDVLLGPNVYVGKDSVISDYGEISNTIILENVTIGKNFKLNSCIIGRDSIFNFSNLNVKNCVLKGKASSEEDLNKIDF